MAFILNHLSLTAMPGLATLTLHETGAGKNRVVHVIVPIVPRVKLTTAAQKKALAKTLAKAALLDAAAVL